jgi:hypothetical protein
MARKTRTTVIVVWDMPSRPDPKPFLAMAMSYSPKQWYAVYF